MNHSSMLLFSFKRIATFVTLLKFGVFFFVLGRMYAVQKGIKIDSKSKEAKQFLFGLMDQLESVCICSKTVFIETVFQNIWKHSLFSIISSSQNLKSN